ncbi:MAG: hypothetical protein JWR02_2175 [Mucilaginibacter sp.]|nr:hypothetical protein [Mucilaginibacter sp.]
MIYSEKIKEIKSVKSKVIGAIKKYNRCNQKYNRCNQKRWN